RALQPAGDVNLARRRRLELGRARATEPTGLFRGELMAGLDPPGLRAMIAFVRVLAGSRLASGTVEHNMEARTEVWREGVVRAFGELIAAGSPQQVVTGPRVVEAYLGGDDDD